LLVDARGNVLWTGAVEGLPRVIVEDDAPPAGGAVPAERIAASTAVSAALGERLSSLTWTADDGLVAELSDGRRVIFGAAEQMPLKLAVVEAVLSQPEDWTLLDAREPDRPYVQ
jgi:hypothetical protein